MAPVWAGSDTAIQFPLFNNTWALAQLFHFLLPLLSAVTSQLRVYTKKKKIIVRNFRECKPGRNKHFTHFSSPRAPHFKKLSPSPPGATATASYFSSRSHYSLSTKDQLCARPTLLHPATVGVSGCYAGPWEKSRGSILDCSRAWHAGFWQEIKCWPKYVLFAFAMTLTPPQGNLDDTGGEGNVKGAAGFVKLHGHNTLVFHAIVTAPDLTQWETVTKEFCWETRWKTDGSSIKGNNDQKQNWNKTRWKNKQPLKTLIKRHTTKY